MPSTPNTNSSIILPVARLALQILNFYIVQHAHIDTSHLRKEIRVFGADHAGRAACTTEVMIHPLGAERVSLL